MTIRTLLDIGASDAADQGVFPQAAMVSRG
jgi:hypothetical protein